MKRRPRIGVTGPDRGGYTAWFFTRIALARAGARPVRLRPGRFAGGRPLPPLDGVVIGGGADVDPGRYGGEIRAFLDAEPKPAPDAPRGRRASWLLAPVLFLMRRIFSHHSGRVDRARDAFEERVLAHALAEDLPVLGICRGSQFLNIHLGGTLHPDLTGFYGEVGNMATVYPRKRVRLARGSRIAAVLGGRSAFVNSLHKQAVDRLGDGVRATAKDDAGVVQAIEAAGRRFVLGVQWHPEYLPAMRGQQRLFRRLAREAARRPQPMMTLPPSRRT